MPTKHQLNKTKNLEVPPLHCSNKSLLMGSTYLPNWKVYLIELNIIRIMKKLHMISL